MDRYKAEVEAKTRADQNWNTIKLIEIVERKKNRWMCFANSIQCLHAAKKGVYMCGFPI